MVVILKFGTPQEQIDKIIENIETLGVKVSPTYGENITILGLVGDTSRIDPQKLEANKSVERVVYIQEPYKKANRKFREMDSVFKAGGVTVGGKRITVAAGPCSVEGEEALLELARSVKESGAAFLRGGAFKPRTSPYAFQGLGLEGIEYLKKAKAETGLPIVTEIMSPAYLETFVDYVDVIQVGTRNMQNFDLLKELGKTKTPILLKRGMSSTIEELLMSAEYIMSEGNENVILCERGIRTFETYTRNTLDISAVPALKRQTHLPVFVDPSHASGKWWMVEALSKAAVAAGADGLEIEVHTNPECAWSDGPQSLKPEKFAALMQILRGIAGAVGREI
ncbi:MAG: 3-deoxy-7-phosphoheptulonate synthase [Oscillospiraceae bacterium]|jgi:3-deoxy-7-phosphoheptulonate synthase|nr:3-deoxy-7-phosphoheptulonate synthase [Oscillospiraceae bacterium]